MGQDVAERMKGLGFRLGEKAGGPYWMKYNSSGRATTGVLDDPEVLRIWLDEHHPQAPEIEDWPEVSRGGYRDDDRACLEGIVQSYDGKADHFFCEPWPACEDGGQNHTQFHITTDPADAPADALLEWQYPEDEGWREAVFTDLDGKRHAARMKDGTVVKFIHTEPGGCIKGEAQAALRAGPCHTCNGTGKVHGALGVGIMWPCSKCGGS